VNLGGIKKKFQTNVLTSAEKRTGRISKNKERNDNVASRKKATIL
jgi:hypothetical protein